MAERADDAPQADSYVHPKRKAASVSRVEQWRAKLPEKSRARRLFDLAALPVAEASEFRVDKKALAVQLMPQHGSDAEKAARAEEILREAQSIYQQAEDRAAGATARATTLQEAVGIAATLLILGAGLIVGQSALRGLGWVIIFAVLLFGATLALVMSGVRALGAASAIHAWYRPKAGDIVERSQLPQAEARLALAADTLVCYGYNTKAAAWKVSYLAAAAWWYRIALAFIVSMAMLVGVYAVFGVSHHTTSPPSTKNAIRAACSKRSPSASAHRHRTSLRGSC